MLVTAGALALTTPYKGDKERNGYNNGSTNASIAGMVNLCAGVWFLCF